MSKKESSATKENKCGAGTHYDSKTNSCVLDEKE